jgi:hypothetical protein
MTTPEHAAHALLERAAHASPADIFSDDVDLENAKAGADLLVAAKLAKFSDDGRTQIALTNAGRYWALHGGYFALLKEEPAGSGGGRGRNPELEEARLMLMRLRLNTFWWSFGISIAGFIISIISLIVAFSLGGRLFGP